MTVSVHNRLNNQPDLATVRIYVRPYSPKKAQSLISAVIKDFGPIGVSWNWTAVAEAGSDWVLDFWFQNPHDAVVFGLKYAR